MKKTLTTDEINKIVADTIVKMEAQKGTSAVPYIKMDLSIYTSDTLEAIKEAFVASGIRFEDRWGNGSDFVVPIDVKTAPPIFRPGRRDAFTKSDGLICEPGQAKKPRNLGRRDTFTRSGYGFFSNPNQVKKPTLEEQIKDAATQVSERDPGVGAIDKER